MTIEKEKSLRKKVQDFLREKDFRPRRRLGQNFLVEAVFWDKIIAAAAPAEDDSILEIGPGPGFLSAALAPRVKRYIAVEIDPLLAGQARENMSGSSNVEVRQDDILELDWKKIWPAPARRGSKPGTGRRLVISNLPYSISSPVLAKLAQNIKYFDLAVLTLQKEVADRLVCQPGSRAYGSLTVFAGYYFSIKKLFAVPAGAFCPAPGVDSTVIQVEPRRKPPVKLNGRPEDFFRFVQMAFSQRRKQLVNSVKFGLARSLGADIPTGELLSKLLIPGRLRIEELSLKQLADIFNEAERST